MTDVLPTPASPRTTTLASFGLGGILTLDTNLHRYSQPWGPVSVRSHTSCAKSPAEERS